MALPPASIVWDDHFREYEFGLGHPFSEVPRYLSVLLLHAWEDAQEAVGLFDWIAPVEAATREQIGEFHRPEYIELVRHASDYGGHLFLDRGDTPSFPGCYEASARLAGGFLAALRASEEHGRPAFHPAGGLHHAAPTSASGFCIFNDLAIGLANELRREPRRKVAYLDIDAHHGDGVMYGFYGDGRVLDIDFHQDGRTLFPGTGEVGETGRGDGAGLKVNLPLPPGAGDEAFVPLFARVVPPLLREYRPDLIVLQHDVDGHAGDRLAQLQYTRSSYQLVLSTLLQLRRELGDPRLVVTGGGGYTPAHVVCRLAEAGIRLTEQGPVPLGDTPLPTEWSAQYSALTREEAPKVWNLFEPPLHSGWTQERTERLLEQLARHLGRRFPREDLPLGEAER